MQSLKLHTALLVVCLLGQKLGDNVVSLSQLSAVSTFSYGKVFHKTFFTKTQGCFLQYPCYPRSGAKSEASLALSCVLRPPLGWCLTQQSSPVLFFLLNVGVGVRVQGGCFLSLWTSSPCLGKVAGNTVLLNLWLRSSGQERQDPREPYFLTYTSHWPEVLVTVL